MKKQLNQLRRFFARTGTKRLNAATAREAIPASYDDDDGSNRLSGAFVVVLLLHVIALVGVFAFSRMKDPKAGSGSADAAAKNLAKTQPAAVPALESTESSAALPEPETTREPVSETAQETTQPAPARSSTGRSWIVKSGETLSKIAFAHNVRITDLKAANNLKSDEIRVGQELVIPDSRTARATPEVKAAAKTTEKVATNGSNASTYTVKKNDALVKIARERGVKYEDLIKLNNIKDPRKIQEGQVLKLPKKS